SGRLVAATGTYTDTLRYVSGCDSIHYSIQLQVTGVIRNTEAVSICAGQRYTLPSGRIVSANGTYNDTLRSVSGCDSIITSITLQNQQPLFQNLSASLCPGESFTLPSGKSVSSTGIYNDTIRYVSGCDSLISIINVSVTTPQVRFTNAGFCAGQTYTLPGGRVVSSSGVYSDTLRNVNGCDSIIQQITLDLIPVERKNAAGLICAGQTYTLPSGRVVNSPGIFNDTIRYTGGCDSLITVVTLTAPPVQNRSVSASVCPLQNYILPSGRAVNAPGRYLDTLRYANGCDSVITMVTLNVWQPVTNNLTAGICAGQRYTLPSGREVSTSGIYSDTLRFAAGCDSVIFRVTLSVSAPVSSSNTVQICSGANYRLPGGRVVNTAGTYRDTLKTVQGNCDSIIITTITNLPPLNVTLTGPTQVCAGDRVVITATASGGNGGPYTYNWIGVNGNGNQATFVATQTAEYFVSVSDGCTITPARDSITIVSVPLPLVDAGPDTAIHANAPFILRPVYSNDVVSYVWSPNTYLSCTDCPAPIVTLEKEMVYNIRVENSAGCVANDSRRLRLVCDVKGLFIPTGFTPNGDGLNDVWYPLGNSSIKVRFLRIFNRWGQVVFERSNFFVNDRTAGWDGTFSGNKLASGGFIYRMAYECEGGELLEAKGEFTLIR
ncbi:MAG: gliding motility-associated C-terminal domain-containing protein, partial [Chitinophagaceae bacterium]|nr:gliding motility-associated C-terminal domain-containing protein [Chitinophagaceae bacterium]